MTEEQGRTAADEKHEDIPEQPTANRGPDELSALPKRSYLAVVKRVVKEFRDDNVTVWAAALTYYGVLSIFPGLLLLVTILRLFGSDTVKKVADNVAGVAPGAVGNLLKGAAESLSQGRANAAGLIALFSLAGALWSASGYVGVFMKAANVVYDVPEGRPVWKTLPIRIGVTIVTEVLLTVAALMVVFTGSFARRVGELAGIGSTAVTVWNIAKWPVLFLIVVLLFAILYWASPNAKHGGFRWVSPGSAVAVVIWLLASAGFGLYVAKFSSYNKTYGSLAAVIVFLVWLWISNLAILLGAELAAELQRSRGILVGCLVSVVLFLVLRDTRKLDR